MCVRGRSGRGQKRPAPLPGLGAQRTAGEAGLLLEERVQTRERGRAPAEPNLDWDGALPGARLNGSHDLPHEALELLRDSRAERLRAPRLEDPPLVLLRLGGLRVEAELLCQGQRQVAPRHRDRPEHAGAPLGKEADGGLAVAHVEEQAGLGVEPEEGGEVREHRPLHLQDARLDAGGPERVEALRDAASRG